MLCFRSSATAKEEVAQGIFLNVYFIKLLNDFNSIPLTFPRQLEDRTPVEFRPSLSAEHTFLFIQIQETKKEPS